MPTACVNTQDTVRVPDARPPPRALFPATNHSLPPRWPVGYLPPFPFISVLPSKSHPKPRRLVGLFLTLTQTWPSGAPRRLWLPEIIALLRLVRVARRCGDSVAVATLLVFQRGTVLALTISFAVGGPLS